MAISGSSKFIAYTNIQIHVTRSIFYRKLIFLMLVTMSSIRINNNWNYENLLITNVRSPLGTVPAENIFFIICFYTIMHRTTTVQNKILSIICSCFFFCLANIYWPSLGKGWLGKPNPKLIQPLNLYLRREKKDHSTQNCMHYNDMKSDFQFWL